MNDQGVATGSIQNNGFSVGGVMTSSTFQKTGGVITGNTNGMTTGAANQRKLQILVHYGITANTNSTSFYYLDEPVGEDLMLFVQGVRARSPYNGGTAAELNMYRPAYIPLTLNRFLDGANP
jgi:hypothetical protein